METALFEAVVVPASQSNWVVGTLLVIGVVLVFLALSSEDGKPR